MASSKEDLKTIMSLILFLLSAVLTVVLLILGVFTWVYSASVAPWRFFAVTLLIVAWGVVRGGREWQ